MAEASHTTKGLVRLTMACNERCPFCNVPMEDYPRRAPPMEALLAEVDAFAASGQQTLTISGGEPTLSRSRLLTVVRAARQRGVRFQELQTNATLLTPDYAAALAAEGLTSAFVSLLSHRPDLHDALAGLPGALPRCLAGIDALLAAGISVTLNPVIAASTQALLPDYIDFVAARLPGVTSISVSAVQPHGRAAHALALLPDYAALGPAIRAARARARAHGITLLNPFCGLPLCVGWEDALTESVEAQEALARASAPMANEGQKSHGPPCAGCALRPRCGGAWHAYWAERGGVGLSAPAPRCLPWEIPSAPAVVAGLHTVVSCDSPTPNTWAALAAATTPTVWLWAQRLHPEDLPALLTSGCTDLCVALSSAPPALDATRRTLQALRRLQQRQPALPQARIRVVATLPHVADAPLAAAVGVEQVVVRVPPR